MLTTQQKQLVENHLNSDPVRVALITGDRAVAAQVDALQRARAKLPTFFDARCEMPLVALQQSTGEAIARTRCLPGGELAIDLTCGLGVDTYYISKGYKRVITCEIDPSRAEIARENFLRLGAQNIEVRCCSAEDFLASFSEKADLIFCDPARRDKNGKKVADVRSCSPNVVEMFHEMAAKADKIVVKLSPLMDVDETARIFRQKIFQNVDIQVVSEGGECREVVVHWSAGCAGGGLSCQMVGHGAYTAEGEESGGELCPANAKYLYIPDVALIKARCLSRYVKSIVKKGDTWCAGGYLLSAQKIENFAGREFSLRATYPWKPREIRRKLTELEIKKATIYRRDFVQSNDEIARAIGIKEGGGVALFFTKFGGKPYISLAEC